MLRIVVETVFCCQVITEINHEHRFLVNSDHELRECMVYALRFISDECCVHVNLAISVILALERTRSFQVSVIDNGSASGLKMCEALRPFSAI